MADTASPSLLTVDAPRLRTLHAGMQMLAQQFRLPFRKHAWKGQSGNWMGVGSGSSIDFQDHRPYLPGDDPRYIDWHAYARNGQYIMKLYREEVSPRVDLIVDGSASMALTPAKQNRVLELIYFSLESALRTQASVRCFVVTGDTWRVAPVQAWRSHRLEDDSPAGETGWPRLDPLPLRHGSLRVFISDLLYPGQPDSLLRMLRRGRGQAVCFAPFCAEEADPDWQGNIELIDCEAGTMRRQRVEDKLMSRYRDAYHRHQGLWLDQARRQDIPLVRVPAAGQLGDVWQAQGLRAGAVETWLG